MVPALMLAQLWVAWALSAVRGGLSWQAPGMVLGWGPLVVPNLNQTQDVALDQGHLTRFAASVGPRQPAGVWGVPVSRELGPWSPPQVGLIPVKAEEVSTRRRGTNMLV